MRYFTNFYFSTSKIGYLKGLPSRGENIKLLYTWVANKHLAVKLEIKPDFINNFYEKFGMGYLHNYSIFRLQQTMCPQGPLIIKTHTPFLGKAQLVHKYTHVSSFGNGFGDYKGNMVFSLEKPGRSLVPSYEDEAIRPGEPDYFKVVGVTEDLLAGLTIQESGDGDFSNTNSIFINKGSDPLISKPTKTSDSLELVKFVNHEL